MKKVLSLTVIMTLIFTLLIPAASLASGSIKVKIDGKEQVFDVNPVVKNGRTLVPLRGILEQLGVTVGWEASTRTITLQKLDSKMVLTINSNEALVNGKKIKLDEPAQLVNNRTLVPLRFIAESLGAKVDWDVKTSTISIVSLEEWLMKKTIEFQPKSYSMDLIIDQTMTFAGETEQVKIGMYADMVVDPIQVYTRTSMKMFGEEMVTQEYMTAEGYFIEDPMLGWVKYPDEMLKSILELNDWSSNDPLAQVDMMKDFVETMSAIEKDDYYLLSMSISNEGFMNLMGEMMGMLTGLLPEDDVVEDPFAGITIEKFEFVTHYDKETLYPLWLEGKTKMVMELDGEIIKIEQTMSGSYSSFNEFNSIKIPKEIIEKAIPFEEIDFESLVEIQ